MTSRPLTRREFAHGIVGLGAAASAFGTGSADAQDRIFVPKVNDAINVHPLRRFGPDPNPLAPVITPELVEIQLRFVYEKGFDGMRMTAPLTGRGDFFAALTYARAARSLGIDAVMIVSDFSGFVLAGALSEPVLRTLVLRMYQDLFGVVITPGRARPRLGRIAFQILNEPAHFLGIPPDTYVRNILKPSFELLRRRDPDGLVVGAAEVGNVDGPERMRAMLAAGLEDSCDRIAYHIYSEKIIPLLKDDVNALTWVTESGVPRTESHLGWVRDTFPTIRNTIRDVSRVFYYDLFDTDPGRFRVIDIAPRGPSFDVTPESKALIGFWEERVARSLGSREAIGFDEIIPRISAFLPTASDIRAYDDVMAVLSARR